MTATIIFKNSNEKPVVLNDVTAVRIGSAMISPVYTGDQIKTACFTSEQDITFTFEGGTYIVAKNTFRTIELN